MKIILIRHAEVKIDKNTFVYAADIPKWIDVYNNAEIKKHFVAKEDILEILDSSDKIFCSALKRSSDSVAMYGKAIDKKDSLFNEVGLPYPMWRGVKLPLMFWAVLLRLMWLLGYKENGESVKEAKVRAKKITDKLVASCEMGLTVTLLGHGLMNRIIAQELLERGWTSQEKMGTENWDYGIFESKS